jgi:hypothetical protein
MMDHISYGKVRLYQGVLIPYQSYHANYACLYGRVAMSDGDGTASSTQVLAVRCAWVHVAVSSHVRY